VICFYSEWSQNIRKHALSCRNIIWHITCMALGSRWYTSALHIATVHTSAFSPLWHEGLFSKIKKWDQATVSRRWQLASRRCLANRFNSQVLLTGSKQMVIIAFEFGAVEREVRNLPTIAPISDPVISVSVDTFGRKWVTCDLQQMPAGSKLSFHSRRHLILISSTPGEKPCCHGGTNA